MTRVKLADLVEGLDFSSFDGMDLVQAYVCRETGKVYCLMEEADVQLEEVPEDLATSERYIPLPSKRDFDLGSALVMDFAAEVMPDQAEQVRADFRRSGAYRRFKDRLMRAGLTERWYAFEQAATARAVREWAEAEGFEVEG